MGMSGSLRVWPGSLKVWPGSCLSLARQPQSLAQQELWRQQEPASGSMAGQRGQASLVPWIGMRLLLAP